MMSKQVNTISKRAVSASKILEKTKQNKNGPTVPVSLLKIAQVSDLMDISAVVLASLAG